MPIYGEICIELSSLIARTKSLLHVRAIAVVINWCSWVDHLADYEYRVANPQGHSPPAMELARFEEFAREDVPRRVRERLELLVDSELRPVEERLRAQVLEIVRSCLPESFQTFRQSEQAIEALETGLHPIIWSDAGQDPSNVVDNALLAQIFPMDSLERFFTEPAYLSGLDDEINFGCVTPKAQDWSESGFYSNDMLNNSNSQQG